MRAIEFRGGMGAPIVTNSQDLLHKITINAELEKIPPMRGTAKEQDFRDI